MNLFTIGFTKKTAQDFFELLIKNDVKRVIDIRLNNKSHLAGFAKQENLQYFLKKIGNIEYIHLLKGAPTKELLNDYKKKNISWEEYERKYFDILENRNIVNEIDFSILDKACLLCSEAKPEYCHRRLFAEYLAKHKKEINISHL